MPNPKQKESKQEFLSRCTSEVASEGRESDQAFAMCNLMWDNSKAQRSTMSLSAPVELGDAPEDGRKPRSFMITAYTGVPINRYGINYAFDVEGISFKAKMPILREHQRDRIVGKGEMFKEDGTLFVKGAFSKSTKDAKEVIALADEGHPWEASIGIWPKKVRFIENGSETVNGHEVMAPAEIWDLSEVRETSFVTLGADDQTAAIALEYNQGGKINVELTKEEVKKPMDLQTLTSEHPTLLAQVTDEAHASGVKAGQDSERQRISEIRELAFDGQDGLVDELIKSGASVLDASKKLNAAKKESDVQQLTELRDSDIGDLGTNADSTDTAPKTLKASTPAEAGDKLDKIAHELMAAEGMKYSKAFKQAGIKNPELFKTYTKRG